MSSRLAVLQPTRTRAALAAEIWRACDILRRDDNCGGVMEYVEHLAWLLFLRFLDAQEERWKAKGGQPYERVLNGDLRWSSWARKDWKADELPRFVHEQLIPALQALSGSHARETVKGVFCERNVVVAASPHNLKDVLEIVDGIDFFSEDDIFVVSQVYEDLLQRLGNENRVAGEFYTPRPVIRFMVELVDPQVGETVYDPACGSCGFLVQAYQHIVAQAEEGLTMDQEAFLQQQTFYGQEKKAVPALLGLMNMVLHGVTAPKVVRCNTLEEDIRDVEDRFDVILTNPPFGGTENRRIQANFPVRSSATELLYLQHIMEKLELRDGARCGMVVPEGSLFRGGAFGAVRRELLERYNLHSVVSLPPGSFAPYSDVKTALLFFERPGPTCDTWYYELPPPQGMKKFSKGSPIQDEHFEEARELRTAWDAQRRGHDRSGRGRVCVGKNAWIVPMKEIEAREYDLSARNPSRQEAECYRDPDRIVAGLLRKEQEVLGITETLLEIVRNGGDEPETLPGGWEWRRLAEQEVAEIIMGQSPPGSTYNEAGEGLPFFQGKTDFGELYPVPSKWCTAPKKVAQAGDVLISVRAPVGPTNLCAETCCIGRGLAAIRPGPQMESKFLLFVLRGMELEIARRGQGSTFAGITKQDLTDLKVPVPALDEQRRIVEYMEDVLGQVTELKRIQSESAAELRRLRGAVLAQLIGRVL